MRRKKKGFIPFAPIFKDVLSKPEWKSLSRSEKLIYIYIKANYNGRNNGEIPFTYLSVKGEFASATISKALKGLIRNGWIEKTEHGGLFRYYCLYKLTLKYDRVFKSA